MSKKEIDRIPTIKKLCEGKTTASGAAEILCLSTRQARRLKKRFNDLGAKGLIHRSRGRTSNNKVDEDQRKKVIDIVKKKYHDFGPTLAHEKLSQNEDINFSVETLRRLMIDEGLWKSKIQRKVKIYQQRQRRTRKGELIQMDSSPHAWFEERADKCDLLLAIDDATGQIMQGFFNHQETTNAYFNLMRGYLARHGKPIAIYVDKNSIFVSNSNKVNPVRPTQFTNAMNKLGIKVILANSPQAKGRVERANKTLQDRLIKEMRLLGISTIDEGNKYLTEYITLFNRKFAIEAKDKKDAHRPLLPSEDPIKILVKKHQRTLSKNLEFQFEGGLYQIKTDRVTYAMRNAPVIITKDAKNKVRVYYKDKRLDYKVIKRSQVPIIANSKKLNSEVDRSRKAKTNTTRRPSKDHPWRHMSI